MRSEKEIKDMLDDVAANLQAAEKDLALRQRHIKELKAKRALLQWAAGQPYKEG